MKTAILFAAALLLFGGHLAVIDRVCAAPPVQGKPNVLFIAVDDLNHDTYEWTDLASRPEHAALKVELAKHFPTTNVPEVKGAAGKGDDSENATNKAERRAKRKTTQDK